MKHNNVFLIALLLLTSIIQVCKAEEFIYPIAHLDNDYLLLIHQKSLDNLELWIWNKDSKIATKALSTMFIPAHVTLLHNQQGFSFIDRGRIRIKEFDKRAPKTVEVFDSLYLLSALSWISNDQCYFTAKKNNNHHVFTVDLSQPTIQLYQLTDDENVDHIYPQKVNNALFYITRAANTYSTASYTIQCQNWNDSVEKSTKKLEMVARKNKGITKEKILKSEEPICFLQMNSEKEGFYLEYPTNVNNDHEITTSFSCYHLIKEFDEEWKQEYLFSFTLPTNCLVGDSEKRVYESISPFLPNYCCDGFIYYVNYDSTAHVCYLQQFDLKTKEIQAVQIAHRSIAHNNCFAPLIVDNKLFCGVILDAIQTRSIMNQSNFGRVFIELPEVEIASLNKET